MGRTGPTSAALPTTQMGTAALWLTAAVMPPSIWRVPDGVFEAAFPAASAILFIAGLMAIVLGRDRRPALVVGTIVCGLLFGATVALTVLMPTSLPDF